MNKGKDDKELYLNRLLSVLLNITTPIMYTLLKDGTQKRLFTC
jgi:hypothetical protein